MTFATEKIIRWSALGTVGLLVTAGSLHMALSGASGVKAEDAGSDDRISDISQTREIGGTRARTRTRTRTRTSASILNAVARAEEISVDEARKRLDRQAKLARVADRLNADLDTSETAGVYIDQEAGQLVVNVLREGTSRTKREDVREDVVRNSSEDLARTEAAVERAVDASRASGLTWAIDVRANAVVVAVDELFTDTEETRELLDQLKDLGPVVKIQTVKTIEETDPATKATEPAKGKVVSGDRIDGCSAGWSARDRNGQDMLLTAGHCVFDDDQRWTHAGQSLGQTVAHNNGPQDWAVIRYDADSEAEPSAKVNLDEGYGLVIGHSRAPVGSMICKSGFVSGLSCGTITASEISSAQGEVTLKDMVGMRMCSDSGDSGGPVFVPRADGTVIAQGLISGGIEACNPKKGGGDTEIIDNGMFYQPIDTVLDDQDLVLRTGSRR